jgi:ribose/xylose/arabinose/galactoside ABC-type transport system permease subunit
MANIWAGVTAGFLAGASGATAQNAVSYLDQAVRGDAPTASPTSPNPARTAAALTGADPERAAGLGPLGGLGVGVGVGAVAGAIRGASATPPPTVAALVTGLAAMVVSQGLALATGTARPDWNKPVTLLRDLLPHLAYGAVTSTALHRMLDPHTSAVSR